MSQEILDLTRRAFEYLERTGEVLPEAFHPNIVLSLTKFPGAILPGNFVGVVEINELARRVARGLRRLVVRYRGGLHIAEHHESGMMFSFDVAPATDD